MSYKFEFCSDLTSVTIGNSVTSIDKSAFSGCSSLTSVTFHCKKIDSWFSNTIIKGVTIGNEVISIGGWAFSGCSSLTSVNIENGLTSIDRNAFEGCSGLTSVTIPNSVTSIGSTAFAGCSSLTSVTIPNSVTSIGGYTFYGCSGLTAVTIPNNVISIGGDAFKGCNSLTSISIPNSVTSIGSSAFESCSRLTSVTIGSGVTSIGDKAFYGCDIPEVISKIENPFNVSTNTFSDNTFYNATLYVPAGTIEKYKATEGWKKFVFIEDGNGSGDTPEPPKPMKCATPTISCSNGKLTFSCETENVTFIYDTVIEDKDIKGGIGNKVQFSVTYHISVYATKDGYENSVVATATLCWIDAKPQMEGIDEDAVTEVKALPVLIQTQGGNISIRGVTEGTPIAIYGIDGRQYGTAIADKDRTTIKTSLQPSSVAIVKIGEKSVKVLVK